MATYSGVRLAPDVVCELVGDQVVVLIPSRSEVLSLSGDQADVCRRLQEGQTLSRSDDAHVRELIAADVVVADMSRRSLLVGGGLAAGAGFALMALPGVAAATSLTPFLIGIAILIPEDEKVDFVDIFPINVDLPALNTVGSLRIVNVGFDETVEVKYKGASAARIIEGIVYENAFQASSGVAPFPIAYSNYLGSTLTLTFNGITITGQAPTSFD